MAASAAEKSKSGTNVLNSSKRSFSGIRISASGNLPEVITGRASETRRIDEPDVFCEAAGVEAEIGG